MKLEDREIRRELIAYLEGGGPRLPVAGRGEEFRKEYVERAEALPRAEVEAAGGQVTVPPVRPGRERRKLPAPLKAAAVAALVMALLVTAGVGSAFAMPGDPLYSVKRLVERARLSLSGGGEARAALYLSLAGRRLDELDFVGGRRMEEWYGPLAGDARESIEDTFGQAGRMRGRERARREAEAREAEARLESLLGELIETVSGREKAELERVRKMVRTRQGRPDAADPPARPQPGPGGPDASPEDHRRQQGPGDEGQQRQPMPYLRPLQQEGGPRPRYQQGTCDAEQHRPAHEGHAPAH